MARPRSPGLNPDDIDLFLEDHLGGRFDPGFLNGYYKEIGFTKGYANRASRDVAELINAVNKIAIDEVHRVHFSYYRRNIDEQIGKFVPFHYWVSR